MCWIQSCQFLHEVFWGSSPAASECFANMIIITLSALKPRRYYFQGTGNFLWWFVTPFFIFNWPWCLFRALYNVLTNCSSRFHLLSWVLGASIIYNLDVSYQVSQDKKPSAKHRRAGNSSRNNQGTWQRQGEFLGFFAAAVSFLSWQIIPCFPTALCFIFPRPNFCNNW